VQFYISLSQNDGEKPPFVCFYSFVCMSVRIEKFGSRWTNFRGILCRKRLLKPVRKIQSWLKSHKNKTTWVGHGTEKRGRGGSEKHTHAVGHYNGESVVCVVQIIQLRRSVKIVLRKVRADARQTTVDVNITIARDQFSDCWYDTRRFARKITERNPQQGGAPRTIRNFLFFFFIFTLSNPVCV
jgi:hypothetical protein